MQIKIHQIEHFHFNELNNFDKEKLYGVRIINDCLQIYEDNKQTGFLVDTNLKVDWYWDRAIFSKHIINTNEIIFEILGEQLINNEIGIWIRNTLKQKVFKSCLNMEFNL